MATVYRYDGGMTLHLAPVPPRTLVVAIGLPEMAYDAPYAPEVIVHQYVTRYDYTPEVAEIRAKMAFRDRYGFVPQRVLIAPTDSQVEIAAEDVGRY